MPLADFTPVPSLIGGVLIGIGASAYLLVNGRIAGISGMLTGLMGAPADRRVRLLFLLGMVAVGAAATIVAPGAIGASPRGLGAPALAGPPVGFGTAIAHGRTRGHGGWGMHRGSPASEGRAGGL